MTRLGHQLIRTVMTLATALLVLIPLAALPASADTSKDSIKNLKVDITLDASGKAHITETFDWNFGTRKGLGFYRTLVTAMGYDPDPDKIRVYEVSGERVISPSGAPASIWRESETNGKTKFSIGAPDGSNDRVSGIQKYRLDYDVAGTINAIEEGQNTVESLIVV
ncbi:DUF2207 domain-containing protein [Bowdeniella nasicola]|nr:DUF2207 domain-containing protein [Bowdeniella nasicola]